MFNIIGTIFRRPSSSLLFLDYSRRFRVNMSPIQTMKEILITAFKNTSNTTKQNQEYIRVLLQNNIELSDNEKHHILCFLCLSGNLEMTRFFLQEIYVGFNIRMWFNKAFSAACKSGNCALMNYLYVDVLQKDIDLTVNNGLFFVIIMSRGHTAAAKWMSRQCPEYFLHDPVCANSAFQAALRGNKIHAAMHFLEHIDQFDTNAISLSADNFRAMIYLKAGRFYNETARLFTREPQHISQSIQAALDCSSNQCDFVAKLLILNPHFISKMQKKDCFSVMRHVCVLGRIDLVIQLYGDMQDNICISHNNDELFRATCRANNLDVAQWLFLEANQQNTINIQACNHEAFIHACRNGHLPIVSWLASILPHVYEFNIIRYDRITHVIHFSLLNMQNKTIQQDNIIQCPLCMEQTANVVTICEHQFCSDCLYKWSQAVYHSADQEFTCPCCRKSITGSCFPIQPVLLSSPPLLCCSAAADVD